MTSSEGDASAIARTAIGSWLERLAEPAPDPGGGAAAALVVAAGAALVSMSAGYAPPGAQRDAIAAAAGHARTDALSAADEDAQASAALVAAFGLAVDHPERAQRVRTATLAAAATSTRAVGIARTLVAPLEWLAAHGEPRLAPDVAVAARLLAAGVRATIVNLRCDATAAEQFGADAASVSALRAAESSADALADELDARAASVTASL